MSEKQRLGELAKLVGKLRYAVDGGDGRQVQETVQEMEALDRYVPEKYRLGDIIAAASCPARVASASASYTSTAATASPTKTTLASRR